ncbi:MAG: ATP-binding protein [Polyangiaceae bacterium]
MPLAIATPLLLGWLSLLGEKQGFYGLEFGLALFAISNVVTFSVLVWRTARWLNRADDERREAELAARRLAAIVQSSDDAIIGKDLSGLVTSWNAAAERLFGYSAREIIGQPGGQLVPAERRDEEIRILEQVRRGERVLQLETLRLTSTGRPVAVSMTVSPIRDATGAVVGLSKVARDISERKRLDAQLQASFDEIASLNATLEARVMDRTAELQAANSTLEVTGLQLTLQKADLQRSNHDLEQFAHVASHDLQEPLRGVAGCAQILERRYRGQLDAEADELIRHVVEGASRMQRLILDLLDYSRVGTRGTQFALVESAVALEKALRNLKTASDECGAQVSADPLPPVRADPVQLTQLFQNLVGNALKYRGTERPAVHVGFRRQGSNYEFSVADNGIGIEPQYFERIFLIFQRLHTRIEYPGTGIGLALCKKIVERHGGKIWLESAPARGTIFRFTIPAGE